MRFTLSLACASVALLASGCAAHRVSIATTVPDPVVVSDTVREELPNDYLRVSFLPAGVEATTLSRPGALRAFVTATPLYSPPLKLQDLPYYSGLVNDDKNVLVAMRCRPPHPETDRKSTRLNSSHTEIYPLSLHDALPIYSPPLKLQDLPYYSGLVNDDKNVLVAMRCRPPHPETVDALLATWPNVFLAIQHDVPLNPE